MIFLKVELACEGYWELTPGSQLKGNSDTLLVLRFFLFYVEKVKVILETETQTARLFGYFANQTAINLTVIK